MKAEIYSKSSCPWCIKAKNLLKLKGVEYTEYLLDKGEATKADIEARTNGTPVRTVPQIFIDGEHVGGFDQLAKRFGV